MKRWAANLFCLFSLLIFATSVTLWVRSYYVDDLVSHLPVSDPRGYVVYQFDCSRGALRMDRMYTGETDSPFPRKVWFHQCEAPEVLVVLAGGFPELSIIDCAGFQVATFTAPNGAFSRQDVIAPLWLFLPAAVPPFLWWRKWRKRDTRGFPVSVTAEKQMQ